MEYSIWCDESVKRGSLYSNFYGGVLVKYTDMNLVVRSIQQKKNELNLHREVKWTKVTENYQNKYKELMTFFLIWSETTG